MYVGGLMENTFAMNIPVLLGLIYYWLNESGNLIIDVFN